MIDLYNDDDMTKNLKLQLFRQHVQLEALSIKQPPKYTYSAFKGHVVGTAVILDLLKVGYTLTLHTNSHRMKPNNVCRELEAITILLGKKSYFNISTTILYAEGPDGLRIPNPSNP